MVAGADVVEAVVAVGDDAGEDVEAAGRALRVGLGAHVVGQRQLLDQRHQVGAVALEHGAVAQVDLLEGEPLDLLLDRRVDVGQEGAAQRPGEVAEAQVDAGRLDRLGADPVVAGADPLASIASARGACEGKTPRASARSSGRDYSPRLRRRRGRASARTRARPGSSSLELLGLAGEHPPAEQRGDAADHRFVGRRRHRARRRAPPARPRAGRGRSSRPPPGSGRRRRGRRAGPRPGRCWPAPGRRRSSVEQGGDRRRGPAAPTRLVGRGAGVDDLRRGSARSPSS